MCVFVDDLCGPVLAGVAKEANQMTSDGDKN